LKGPAVDDEDQRCDVCDGSGLDPDDKLADCHLCEGAGWFRPDGFPLGDDAGEDD